jgi:hypothetical protein
MPNTSPKTTIPVQIKFGRRYGLESKIVPAKSRGKDFAGRARTPPIEAPIMVLQKIQIQVNVKQNKKETHPRHQTNGMIE